MRTDRETSNLFIKEHVEGCLKPIDIHDIQAVSMVQIKEEYITPEQIRTLSYLEHLSSDAKQLKRVLGKYRPSRLKAGTRDLPLAIAQQWKRFSCERLCNMKKSEWAHNTGSSIEFMRILPSNGQHWSSPAGATELRAFASRSRPPLPQPPSRVAMQRH